MKLLNKNTKLNDRIIQQLYRIKTIDPNSEWDVIWYLGGKNQVTLGEKAGKYYLLPPEDLETKEKCFTCLNKFTSGGKLLVGFISIISQPNRIKTVNNINVLYSELTLYEGLM